MCHYDDIPSDLLGLIESYLPPSSCVSLSATCLAQHVRWTSLRWKKTFFLHYDVGRQISTPSFLRQEIRWEYYHVRRYGCWEKSFVGDLSDSNEAECTVIDLSSLVPSLRRIYYHLWNKIELSMLGYDIGDIDSDSSIRYSGAKAVRKVISMLGSPLIECVLNLFFLPRKDIHMKYKMQTFHLSSVNPWKIACILREKGVNCFRCRLCSHIDVSSKHRFAKEIEESWIVPCRCTEGIHRDCLEAKLNLKQQVDVLNVLKGRESNSKMWISYDAPFSIEQDSASSNDVQHPARVINGTDRFQSPYAVCDSCGERYKRTVRLPKSVYEVVTVSLTDPLAIHRLISTVVHFLFCILLIAVTEGKCIHELCENQIMVHCWGFLKLGWPSNFFNSLPLLLWQLQQSCMLHIFFSPRFVAIVDRLWQHQSCVFYIKLYIYFVVTSFFLMMSYIPFCARWCYDIALGIFNPIRIQDFLPVLQCMKICNLLQYTISSSTVIAIFWRTNYRIYTVANRNGSSERDMNDHPIYHGNWR